MYYATFGLILLSIFQSVNSLDVPDVSFVPQKVEGDEKEDWRCNAIQGDIVVSALQDALRFIETEETRKMLVNSDLIEAEAFYRLEKYGVDYSLKLRSPPRVHTTLLRVMSLPSVRYQPTLLPLNSRIFTQLGEAPSSRNSGRYA